MQTATKTVTRGIYNRVPTGEFVGNVEQYRTIKTGERVNKYTFKVVDANTLIVNGKAYKVEHDKEVAIKIMKTKVKALGGAPGLLKFFMRDPSDAWELKVTKNCKPING